MRACVERSTSKSARLRLRARRPRPIRASSSCAIDLRELAPTDGEATVLGATGVPDFQALRRELGQPDSKRLVYPAFDPVPERPRST